MVSNCPRVLSVRISLNNTHYSVYSTHLTRSCVQMKFCFRFLLQLFNNNLKEIDADVWELHIYPSSMLKTDQWFLFNFFLPVSCLWQYFVLLACTVTWVALCEGLYQIFWESSNKQCVFVFLYSIKIFFLILERIQLLNNSTLCSIHLVPSTVQKSSVFIHMVLRILLLFVSEKSLGFCRLPSYRMPSLLSDTKVMLTSGNSAQDSMDIFCGVSSHTVPLSCPCIIWAEYHYKYSCRCTMH